MHSTGQRLLYIQVSRSIYKWDDHGNSTYIKEGAYPLHSHHISVISPCMSKPGICSCFTFSLNLQGKKNQTKTEQTWHQDQLKWEEMQSPKYLSYLDLGLLTNLHWDMVTHCSTWREKQCLLKFKKKKKISEIEAPESTVVSCHSLNCSSPFFFFSAKHRNAFQW